METSEQESIWRITVNWRGHAWQRRNTNEKREFSQKTLDITTSGPFVVDTWCDPIINSLSVHLIQTQLLGKQSRRHAPKADQKDAPREDSPTHRQLDMINLPPPRLDGGTVIESWAWTQFIKLTFHWWFRHVTTLWVQFVETFFLYRRDALWAVMGSPCYHQVWTRPEHCSQRQVCFQSN